MQPGERNKKNKVSSMGDLHPKLTKVRRSMTAKEKRTIWIGQIPEIFGYGIMVAEESEEACLRALKREHKEWKRQWNGDFSFNQAMDYFGGSVSEIELGKGYTDNFYE